jgi:hypothetical protein
MSRTVHETEIKYEAPPGTPVPQLDGLPRVASIAGPQEQLLEAEYYDTGDLRLIRNGVTLRRRRGGRPPPRRRKLPGGRSSCPWVAAGRCPRGWLGWFAGAPAARRCVR